MGIKYLFVAIGLFMWGSLIAQLPATKAEFEKEYQRRIQLDTLNGVYIPADLTDAFIQLNKLIDDESKASFKAMPEEDAFHKLFFSFGRWITLNWGFYGGSRLSNFIKELGVTYPDDMAEFVIVSYHRNLNHQPLDVKAQVTHFQEKRRKEYEERVSKGTVIKEETRKVTKGQSN